MPTAILAFAYLWAAALVVVVLAMAFGPERTQVRNPKPPGTVKPPPPPAPRTERGTVTVRRWECKRCGITGTDRWTSGCYVLPVCPCCRRTALLTGEGDQ